MIDYETFCQIRLLAQEKDLKPSQIAAELDLDIKTVEKWLTRETFQPRQGAKRSSKLDGFKKRIIAQLDRHPYTAQQIFQQLQQQGYAGGYTILKDYVRLVRPVRKPAYLLLEFAAGECAQVDWGQYGSVAVGSTRRRLSFFLMVLCYSRMLYLEFTLSEAMDHFLSCHRRAFEFVTFRYRGGRRPGRLTIQDRNRGQGNPFEYFVVLGLDLFKLWALIGGQRS